MSSGSAALGGDGGPATLGALRGWLAGWNRRSLVALGTLVTVGGAIGYRWSDLLDVNGYWDPLLTITWLLLAALLTWNPSARRDVPLLAVGLAGGTLIEAWGTRTLLWTYFTEERPPLWILPAWPIAALSIDRLATWLEGLSARRGAGGDGSARADGAGRAWSLAWLCLLPPFVLVMAHFARHTLHLGATQLVLAIMVAVVATRSDARRDVHLFVAGALLGILLETWGTTRQCWTYYTGETPPWQAVVAHGFAAVAFGRVHTVVLRVVTRLAPPAAGAAPAVAAQ